MSCYHEDFQGQYSELNFDRLLTIRPSRSPARFRGGGPGLGLFISKGIIEAHGGNIWAESPGYDEVACPGSTFHIMIPMRNTVADDKMMSLLDNEHDD